MAVLRPAKPKLQHTEALFDKHHMMQVLINLLSNAIKFSQEGAQAILNFLIPKGRVLETQAAS